MKGKRPVRLPSVIRLLEELVVCSVADAGRAADELVPQAIETIAQFYHEPVRLTAKRIAAKIHLEQRAAPPDQEPDISAWTTLFGEDDNGQGV